MPTFNRANMLRRSIESILNQSFKDFEFIIIDDGSTDETSNQIRQFDDSRIKLITLPVNCGNAAARNIGLKIVKGDFIAVMDSDDVSHEHRFIEQFQYMANHDNIDILGTFALKIEGEHVFHMIHPTQDEIIKAKLLALDGSSMIHPTSMMRASFIRKFNISYPNQKTDSDHGLWIQSMLHGGRFSNLPIHLYQYYRHQNNLTSESSHDFIGHQQRKTPMRSFLLGKFYPHLTTYEVESIANIMESHRQFNYDQLDLALRSITKTYTDSNSYWGESKKEIFTLLKNYENAIRNIIQNRPSA